MRTTKARMRALAASAALLLLLTGAGLPAVAAPEGTGPDPSGTAALTQFTAAAVPVISGTAQAGRPLSAAAGDWEPAPVELRYQWEQDGTAVSGATDPVYVPGPDTVGSVLTVTVTGTRPGYGALARTSAPTAAVTAATEVPGAEPGASTAPSGDAPAPGAGQEIPAAEDSPAAGQGPTAQQSPAIGQSPAAQAAPAAEEIPAAEQGPAVTDPAPAEIPVTAAATAGEVPGGYEYRFRALADLHQLPAPSGPVRCGLVQGGCQQDFATASIYRTPAGEYFVVSDPVRAAYWAEAGQGGALGYPESEQRCGLAGGACVQEFTGGDIFITPDAGTHAVRGAFRTHWLGAGGETGALGYPVSGAFCGLIGGGCQQDFTGGTAYLTPSGAVHPVTGSFRGVYWAKAGQGGALGYPVTDRRCGLTGGGCQQDFAGGTLYSNPAGGVFSVQGAIRTAYWQAAGHGGALGYPTGDHVCGLPGAGCQQNFERGTVSLTGSSAAVASTNPFSAKWLELGGVFGQLGYPVTGQHCGLAGGGCQQDFAGGSLYSNPAGGVFSVQGAIRTAYWNMGGHNGNLGYPTKDHMCGLPGGRCQQNFGGGTVTIAEGIPALVDINPWTLPLPSKSYNFSSRFGPRCIPVPGGSTYHLGQDLAAPENTPIFAAAGGIVVKTKNGTDDVSGIIAIEHSVGGRKFTSAYYHMWNASTHVQVGMQVGPGQQIGLVGNSGPSTANHLHFEVWDGGWYAGTALDSADYLSGMGIDLKANAKVVWNFPTPAVCTYYSSTALNLRAEPTAASTLLQRLPVGTMMTSEPGTIVSGYVPVTVNGQRGWVLAGGVYER